jgi:serine/threonine protein kinase/tetratricopeptide (TPR) repeat protein
MGEVYRAHDPRLKRDVAIKVLPSFLSGDPDRLRRFEQEAQAAATLNHPNILAIHQMGTYEGAPYFVSELLEGSTLREHLKRGPMPLRKMIDYGLQIAHGLAAAHEKGIVHRDLKPENLFVTKDGRVKILDFGLAKLTQPNWPHDSKAPTVSCATEPGAVMGTVGYMSPEQVSGKAADHRSDIFAFGAVLYEMLTGKRAFQKATAVETLNAILNEDPTAVSQLVSTTPPALQRVVQRCLEKDSEQRFQSASDLAFALEALPESSSVSPVAIARPASHRVWPLAGVALVLVTLGLAVGGYFHFRRPPKLTEKDSVVVADFANTTGDTVFDGTLRQGLSVQLAQTPFLSLISDGHIVETLRLMEKPPDSRLTPDVAREVCQRANATTVVEGSIAELGSQYVVGLDAVNCHTGDTLAQEQVTAEGKEKVLNALGNAASELRSKLGESGTSVQAHDVPFDQVTTSSLEALRAWTLGSQALSNGNFPSAISFFQRAISLDPNFAQANSMLGLIYGTEGDLGPAVEYTIKAYRLRDRTSEREKFSIVWNYHVWATEDGEKAVQVAEQWAKLYPRDPSAYLALAGAYEMLGRWEQAAAPAREALRLEPTPYAYSTLAAVYLGMGRWDEARTITQQGEANHVDPAVFRPILYRLAFVQNDTAAMDRQLAGPWMFSPITAPWTFNGSSPAEEAQSWTAAYYGHVVHARELRERAIASARRQGAKGLAADLYVGGAVIEALFGSFAEARKALMDVGDLSTGDFDLQGAASIAWALVGERIQAMKLASDVNKRCPESTYIQFGVLPAVRGLLALQRGEPTEATKALDAISPYELVVPCSCTPAGVPVYIRGNVHLAAHQGAEAAADFQLILDHPGIIGNFPIGALAHLGLGRAYTMQGDTAKARAAYQDFLTLWKDADPDIPILKQAKAEYAKLQ